MAFAPIFNAQNFMLRGGETCGMGQINPHMRDLDIPSINFNTTINLNGGFGGFGKANFASGLFGGYSGTGFGIGGMFGGGRMTTGSFFGGLLGRTLSAFTNVGLFAAFNKIGGGYRGYGYGLGGSIFGGGYGTGYGGGTGWMIDSCYLNPATRLTSPITPTPAAGTPAAGSSASGSDPASGRDPASGTGGVDNSGSGSTTTATEAGKSLLNAVNDKKADGTTEQIFSGVFNSRDNKDNVENGKSAKKGERTTVRGTQAKDDDYKNAVKIGDSKGENTDIDSKTGAPQYFTMTDYRSGNQYTFHLSRFNETTHKLEYKVDTEKSNLTVDDNDNVDWHFVAGVENLIFEVVVNAATGEIELTHNGPKVAYDRKKGGHDQ